MKCSFMIQFYRWCNGKRARWCVVDRGSIHYSVVIVGQKLDHKKNTILFQISNYYNVTRTFKILEHNADW